LTNIILIPISDFRGIFNRIRRINKVNSTNIIENFKTKGIGFDDGLEREFFYFFIIFNFLEW